MSTIGIWNAIRFPVLVLKLVQEQQLLQQQVQQREQTERGVQEQRIMRDRAMTQAQVHAIFMDQVDLKELLGGRASE